jgi:membrane-bound metal-dependent hydrolase YbcI (DUF457 family)
VGRHPSSEELRFVVLGESYVLGIHTSRGAGRACGSIPPRVVSATLVLLSAACSVIPDLDVIGFKFDIRYGDMLGHRGLTHSIFFAAVLAASLALLLP